MMHNLEDDVAHDLGRSPTAPVPNLQLPELTDLWQSTLGWQPTSDQQQQFQRLYDHILEGNRTFNLTRITAPVDFWEKHLWDSLRGLKNAVKMPNEAESARAEAALGQGGVEPNAAELSAPTNGTSTTATSTPKVSKPYRVIDIGTGAGFPGLPVAIAHPAWRVTLLDSTRKKLTFVDAILPALNVVNVTLWVGRAEDIGHLPQHRNHYDMALLRAVAPVTVCAEYALPLLKPGGFAVLYRGQWSEDEQTRLQTALHRLGGAIARVDAFTTPMTQSIRHCVIVTKIAQTEPEFPRSVGIPAKDPL